MSTTIPDISGFTFAELLALAVSHPIFSSRVKELEKNHFTPSYMLALTEWDDEDGDISIPEYFHPFFKKYYPNYKIEVGDTLDDIVERHELPMLKAVIECELHYNGELPKSHTFWRITFIENPSYTINYEKDYGEDGWLRKETVNDNVYKIPYGEEL